MIELPPSDFFQANGRPKMINHNNATVMPRVARARDPDAMKTGSSTYICIRMPMCPQIADVLLPAKAAYLPQMVGALADPNTNKLNT